MISEAFTLPATDLNGLLESPDQLKLYPESVNTDFTGAYGANWDASSGRATLGICASRPILARQGRVYVR